MTKEQVHCLQQLAQVPSHVKFEAITKYKNFWYSTTPENQGTFLVK